jgi:adenosylcobinamide kinase / adenosylcobinamide-phosphate guanylyltransferase
MAEIILVTGGARSGKSALAERLAQSCGNKVIYIATSEPFDDEMQSRIDRHRARRDASWRTVDAPLELPDMLVQTDWDAPRLVDCLTMWLNNLIYHNRDVGDEMNRLIKVISEQQADLVMVTNEIGSGLVPQTAEARKFRDLAGELNQMVAQAASQVYLSVSGISVKIK